MLRTIRILGLLAVTAGVLAGAGQAHGQTKAPPGPPPTAGPAVPEPGRVPQALIGLPPATPARTPQPPQPTALPALPPPPPVLQLPAPGATPAPAAAKVPAVGPSGKEFTVDLNVGPTQANPTSRQEPAVSIEWICPSTVKLGQAVTCQVIVKSLSTGRLHQATLRCRLPAGVVVKASEPKAAAEGELLVWPLGTLEPRQEKRIDLQLVPTARASLALHAFVTFTGSSTARIEVREPKLVLKATAPARAIIGDPAPITLTVTNPGDAAAENVKVRASLSVGLEHGRGQDAEFNLDNLGPGETRTVLVLCTARSTGIQKCTASATAEPGLLSRDAAAVDVVAPRLDVAVSGPGMRYLDRHAVLTLKVTNPGTATANHVTLTDQVPPGFKVARCSGDGRHDFVSRSVVWFLGDVGAGQSKEVTLDLVAINAGEHKNRATVTAARGLRADSELATRVEGLSALLMELVDVDDPVEVGRETSYEVRVTNTGTKTETNLELVCTLPEQMTFVSAKGAAGCPFQVKGREITFAPLPQLAPRADAIYRVAVRCQTAGDVRFQARMKADGLTHPVLREESTRIYGDEPNGPARKQ